MCAEWLPDFFSGDNQINLSKIMSGQYGPAYQEMMTPMVNQIVENRWPIILPFSDGLLRFYAGAQSDRLLSELRRVLRACLGTAYTAKELPIIKEATNSSESVMLTNVQSGLIRIELLKSFGNDLEAKKWVFVTLGKILELYNQRPLLIEEVKRPVGRILREFFTACQVSDGEGAEELLLELKASSSLSQRNLLFIEFQALAAGENWENILEHKYLTYCLSGRIPIPLTRILLKSLSNRFRLLLNGDFSAIDPRQAQEECRILVPLFRQPPRFQELKNVTEEWKVWAIGASLHGLTDVGSYIPSEIRTNWFDNLFLWVGIDGQVSSGAHKGVFPKEKELGLIEVQELLKYTLIAPIEDLPGIVDQISLMPEEVLHQIEENPLLYSHWITLRQKYMFQDYGWNQWFGDICEQYDRAEELQQLAVNESLEWPSSSFNAEAILQILETGDSVKVGEVVRNSMPLLMDWLQEREMHCPARFWVKLLELLALDNIANQYDVQLALLLLDNLFGGSCSIEDYEESLQAIELLLEKVGSVKSYSSILEVVDLLLESPCPSPTMMQSFWLEVQRFALQKWYRLSPTERLLTRFSAKEIVGEGVEAVFEEILSRGAENEEDLNEKLPDLSGKLLAIYSLTEGAARRAQAILTKMFTGLRIEINHDHVATAALENLAKTAEHFVFSSKSAKHQAFYTVSKIRNDLIYPEGKGATSIVRAFVDEVQK